MSFEKLSSDRAVLGALHDIPLNTATPGFDGGVRELPPQPPSIEWQDDPDDKPWQSVELEDGADWLWPGLRR